jgi:PAS domain S-box-containing protein
VVVEVDVPIQSRKTAELALQESRNKLNAYFNSTVESIFLLAPDFTILEFNDVARREVKEIHNLDVRIGDSILAYAEPSAKDLFIANFERALFGEKVETEVKIPFSQADLWRQVKYLPIFNDKAQIVGVAFVSENITARKRQEAEKRRLEARLADILEHTTDGYFTLDKDRRFTYVNPQFERIIRVKREAVIGKNIWVVFPAAVGTKFHKYYEAVIAERVTAEFQEYFAPLNKWFDVYAYPSDDCGLTAYFRDITEEKRREAELSDSQAFLQSIYYGINTPIFVVDVEPKQTFHYVGLNPAFERNLGIASERILGKTIADLEGVFSEELRAQLQSNFTRCLDANREIIFEERLVFQDKVVFLMTRLNPLRDGGGSIYRIVGNSINITKRKQAEEQLRKSEAMLSETERLAHIGSWEFDLATRKITWSAEVFRIFSRDFLSGEPTLKNCKPIL